ncbi:MAG: hypothetical protein EBU93_07935 [Chlamydiae bacterium]|nr:hypothetical protein [Chlamydiota bacterium]
MKVLRVCSEFSCQVKNSSVFTFFSYVALAIRFQKGKKRQEIRIFSLSAGNPEQILNFVKIIVNRNHQVIE